MAKKKDDVIRGAAGKEVDLSGLTPAQIKKVRESKHPANLAKSFRKKNGVPDAGGNIVEKGGTINEPEAIKAVGAAGEEDFIRNNPDIVGPDGSGREVVVDPVTGKTVVKYKGGAPFDESVSKLGGFMKGWGSSGPLDLSGAPQIDASGAGRQKAQDANYAYMTRNNAANKAQELEAAKQELANRGIPIDADNPRSLYNRTIKQIDDKYQALDDQAKQQSIMLGNETFSTDVSAQTAAHEAYRTDRTTERGDTRADIGLATGMAGQFDPMNRYGPIQGGANSGDQMTALIGMMSEAEANRLGLSQQWKLAQQQMARQGGGSSGPSAPDDSDIFGGMAWQAGGAGKVAAPASMGAAGSGTGKAAPISGQANYGNTAAAFQGGFMPQQPGMPPMPAIPGMNQSRVPGQDTTMPVQGKAPDIFAPNPNKLTPEQLAQLRQQRAGAA